MRRYRIQCGDVVHRIDLDDAGHVTFVDHPGAFHMATGERTLAALGGEDLNLSGCLRVAQVISDKSYRSLVERAGPSERELYAALRGIALARRIKRRA